jgi:hypothetical protein
VAGVDTKLSELVARGLSKDRDARPQSMFELGQALAAWLFDQGALEDATGAALEYKWLGRGNESLDLSRGQGGSAPRVRHDEATLVSVVHPAPFVSRVVPSRQPQPRRQRRWAAVAAVVGVAFWVCAGWAVLRGSPVPVASAGSPRVDFTPAAAPGLAAAAAPAPAPASIPLQALPIEAATEASATAAPVTLQVSEPRPSKPTRAARASLWPSPGSLPQALPRSTAARPTNAAKRGTSGAQRGVDLLNPY